MIKKILSLSLIIVATMLLTISCGKKNESDKSDFSYPNIDYLAKAPYTADRRLAASNINDFQQLSDSVRTIRPNPLDSMETSKAAEHLRYNFVGLSTSAYTKNDETIDVEMAEFFSSDDAYGYFSEKRPNGIRVEAIGAESYVLNSTRYVYHDRFVITLSSDVKNESVAQGMIDIGMTIDSSIEETAMISPYYLLFPYREKIIPSTRFVSFNFMNVGSINDVHTTDYLIDDDTLTLFMTVDSDAKKFERLKAYAESRDQIEQLPTGLSFEEKKAIMFIHPVHGRILAGIASEKLIGIIGFDPDKQLKMARLWVWGLQQ